MIGQSASSSVTRFSIHVWRRVRRHVRGEFIPGCHAFFARHAVSGRRQCIVQQKNRRAPGGRVFDLEARVPVLFTVWKSGSSSSCRAPMTPCWSSAAEKLSSIVDWDRPQHLCAVWGCAGGAVLQAVRIRTAFDCGDGRGRVEKAVAPHARGGQPLSGLRGFGSRRNFIMCEWTVARTFKSAVQAMYHAAQEALPPLPNSNIRKHQMRPFRIRQTADH